MTIDTQSIIERADYHHIEAGWALNKVYAAKTQITSNKVLTIYRFVFGKM
jgi:hypothetical protein